VHCIPSTGPSLITIVPLARQYLAVQGAARFAKQVNDLRAERKSLGLSEPLVCAQRQQYVDFNIDNQRCSMKTAVRKFDHMCFSHVWQQVLFSGDAFNPSIMSTVMKVGPSKPRYLCLLTPLSSHAIHTRSQSTAYEIIDQLILRATTGL